MENKPDKILTGKNISRYLNVAGTEAEIITGNPSSQTKVESNKTSKPTPQEKNKKEPNYYKKINQIARLLENQEISQIVFHGGKRESKEGEDDKWKISTDLDAESASILFNLFNKKPLEKMYAEGAHTAIVPKGGSDKDLEIKKEGLIVYIDNGDKWIEVKKDGKKTKVYFDHHGKGRGPNTSATKMVYDLLKKQNPKIEEENPWLFKYVKGVNDFDNLNYLNREYFNKEHFEQVWPYTLNHIASQMKASDLMNLFNSGIITDFSKSIKGLLNEEIELEKLNQDYSTEIRKIKFGDITLKNGKTINEQIAIETSKNIGENNVKKTTTGIENADKFETDLLGKVVFNDNKRIDNKNGNGYHKNIIPNHLAFIGTKALGYDTYIAWNEKDKNFFINSNEEGLGEIIKKLNEADPDCALDVRGVMVFGTIKNLTKEQFKKILGLNEKIGNEKVKTNKHLTENEIKIQKNNEEIAELDKKINELNKEIENMDEEIAKLQAMILALPDDELEPTPQPQAINEPKVEKPEEISLNEGKEGQLVKILLTEKGTFDEKSIMRYFAKIFYNQRGGSIDFKDYEFEKMKPETKSYLLRIYEDLKKYIDSDQFEVFDAEKVIERDKKDGRTGGNIEKIKIFNGKDLWFNRNIIETERQKIDYARMMLSNDLSGRDNGLINGINNPSKTKEIEYPSNEVLENLDEVFRGESAKYNAELIGIQTKENEPKTKEKEEFFTKVADLYSQETQQTQDVEPIKPEKVSIDENKENKITSKDFKELVRLSKFFLENPKEPTTVGSIENKYPELFEEITKIEKRRKEELEILKNYRKTGILKGEVAENFNKKFKVNILDNKGDVNLFDEMDRIINAKYDEELAELEKSKTTTNSTVSSENQEPEKVNIGLENKVSNLKEKKPNKIDFYLSVPNSDGSFNKSSLRKSYTEGASIYAFQGIGNNKYEIYFANQEAAQKLALQYPDKSIDPIFEAVSAFNPKAKSLQIIEPAIVELINGKFNLIRKGEIDYDMVGIKNSEINSQKEYEPKNIIGYFSIPNKDGSFNELAFTEKPQKTSSMYKVEDLGNNRIAVSFWNNIRAVKDATSSPELILYPIWKIKNALNQNATKITTIKPTILEKQSGKYILIEQGEIRYE